MNWDNSRLFQLLEDPAGYQAFRKILGQARNESQYRGHFAKTDCASSGQVLRGVRGRSAVSELWAWQVRLAYPLLNDCCGRPEAISEQLIAIIKPPLAAFTPQEKKGHSTYEN